MNRRKFLFATAAGLAFSRQGFAAPYDLVIKGGRVIDPSLGINAVRDVAIAGGKIAAVEAKIEPMGAQVVNAGDRLVVPGLIDLHSHACGTKDGPQLNLADGVTGFVDAGTQGADHIDDVIAVAKSAPQQARILVNIGRTGLLAGGELMDLANADVALAKDAISRHRDFVIGVKARLSKSVAGANDVEALKRAQEVASSFNLPVMIHMGQSVSPLPALLAILKRGDVVTHLFAPPPAAIIDDGGKLLPEVMAARRRGIWFDMGHGRGGHFRWDIAEKVLAQGFLPDTLSTDWTPEGRANQFVDFPTVMSKLMHLGMSLEQVVACCTVNAARVFEPFRDRGTLNVGAPADVALLELRSGSFEFLDNYGGKRTGRQKLVPAGTVLGGKYFART